MPHGNLGEIFHNSLPVFSLLERKLQGENLDFTPKLIPPTRIKFCKSNHVVETPGLYYALDIDRVNPDAIVILELAILQSLAAGERLLDAINTKHFKTDYADSLFINTITDAKLSEYSHITHKVFVGDRTLSTTWLSAFIQFFLVAPEHRGKVLAAHPGLAGGDSTISGFEQRYSYLVPNMRSILYNCFNPHLELPLYKS